MTDLSRSSVIILFVLLIISLIISALTIIASYNTAPNIIYVTPKTSVGTAEVSLVIQPQPASASTAQVALDITKT